jgi:hypothetical protein
MLPRGLCVVMQLIANRPMGRRSHSRNEAVRAPCSPWLLSRHLASKRVSLQGENKAKPQLTRTADFIFQP